MSDIPINTSSFNQAYRAYAVEQGNDPVQGRTKAKDVANQTASTASLASEHAMDVAYVSPEAARMYAQQLKQRRKVNESTSTSEAKSNESVTGTVSDETGTSKPIEAATEQNSRKK
jgi:hypothetical protein